MVHIIPINKLPSAKEMAKLMLHHVFRLHSFPLDVVSDKALQFVSHFWAVFCTLVG